jgi:hypothetical protein
MHWIAIALLVWCGTSYAQTEPLLTLEGPAADSVLASLPRDTSSFATVGVLFTNRIFLRQTADGRRDADSAIAYLTAALAYRPTPRLQAYLYVARAIRASRDGLWEKLTGSTKNRATAAFEACDSLALLYPSELGVQFLAANLFQEGNKLKQKMYYWQRALEITASMWERVPTQRDFFTPEVQATLLLNEGKLIIKLRRYGSESNNRALAIWQRIIQEFPNTNAAANARVQIEKH